MIELQGADPLGPLTNPVVEDSSSAMSRPPSREDVGWPPESNNTCVRNAQDDAER
jgi:hypothetical protein